MILVLFGASGSGKGTQAEFLKKDFNAEHFSVGSYLRNLISSGSEIGEYISGIINKGELVPDEKITDIVLQELDKLMKLRGKKDTNDIILLDGYPRSLKQANSLLAFCEERKEQFFVIDIEVDEDFLIDRLSARVNCTKCVAPFTLDNSKVCPFCGSSEYFRRDDDSTESAIKQRLSNYKNVMQDVLSFFDNKKIFIIDGNSDINEVKERIAKVVNKLKENV